MKKMNEVMKNEKGFTLIELIIVIAILAIIAAVAVPNILGAVDNSRKATDVSNAKIIQNAAAQVMAKNEDASNAEFGTGTGLAVTPLTVAGITDATNAANEEFSKALFLELNSNPPTPSYKGTDETETNFYLEIVDNSIVVRIGSSGAADDSIEILPTTETAYEQK